MIAGLDFQYVIISLIINYLLDSMICINYEFKSHYYHHCLTLSVLFWCMFWQIDNSFRYLYFTTFAIFLFIKSIIKNKSIYKLSKLVFTSIGIFCSMSSLFIGDLYIFFGILAHIDMYHQKYVLKIVKRYIDI